MESRFREVYRQLNAAQREAVDTLDGPILVIAGPGTGKTQLISTRIGNILNKTDTPAQNILCLTFTEAGATAMRERLSNLFGQQAYEINISTYHAFGSELLRRNPEYFEDFDLKSIDNIGAISLLQRLIRRLPYSNSMKFMDNSISDVIRFISDNKRAFLLPEDVIDIAQSNIRYLDGINRSVKSTLKKLGMINKKSAVVFRALLVILESKEDSYPINSKVRQLGDYAVESLREALAEFDNNDSTKALTQWKNSWLAKDANGNFIFGGRQANQKILAAGQIYAKYQEQLKRNRLYDYDDMILRAIIALENNPDFKYTLAEQYMYIMLDEFQDTNRAQMQLIELLTDHPVLEGRPNILAVGDDDQAIYAFQGADHANMMEFIRHYKDVKIISLSENYRSTKNLVETAANLAGQISERLHYSFRSVRKDIVAANKKLPAEGKILAREFKSDAAQYGWVAWQIKKLIEKNDIPATEIAVLAPKHRYLTPLLPFLNRQKIPIRYEKRENILDEPAVRQLEQMARLTVASGSSNQGLADSLWPEVISYDYWGLSTEDIWQTSWDAAQSGQPWIRTLLRQHNTRDIALFFLRLKDQLYATTLEQQFDVLIGVGDLTKVMNLPFSSPFYNRYFGDSAKQDPSNYVSLMSNLSVLRDRLQQWRTDESLPMNLNDFIAFIDAHRSAELPIINSSPYYESEDSVNIMTAYAAKGREFTAVFLLAFNDEVWGSASRNLGSRISLPVNIRYIRYQGASEDERLRLLYVAATRAKTHLYLTSYSKTLAGRPSSRLKYLQLNDDGKGNLRSQVLPDKYNLVAKDDSESVSVETLRDYWVQRHQPPFSRSLDQIIRPRLETLKITPSHINQFTDVVSEGPESFLTGSLLYFPPTPSPVASYGSAIHESLRWFMVSAGQRNRQPDNEQFRQYFERQLKIKRLTKDEFDLLLNRGKITLTKWRQQQHGPFKSDDRYEYNFVSDGVFIGDTAVSGKIDRLIIDKNVKKLNIVDFKTGAAYQRWDPRVIKLHKYRQQLMMYKLLAENSARFRGYEVNKLALEFVEPDSEGRIRVLELKPTAEELEAMRKLVLAIWRRAQILDLPDISRYPKTIAGILEFERDLIKEVS